MACPLGLVGPPPPEPKSMGVTDRIEDPGRSRRAYRVPEVVKSSVLPNFFICTLVSREGVVDPIASSTACRPVSCTIQGPVRPVDVHVVDVIFTVFVVPIVTFYPIMLTYYNHFTGIRARSC